MTATQIAKSLHSSLNSMDTAVMGYSRLLLGEIRISLFLVATSLFTSARTLGAIVRDRGPRTPSAG